PRDSVVARLPRDRVSRIQFGHRPLTRQPFLHKCFALLHCSAHFPRHAPLYLHASAERTKTVKYVPGLFCKLCARSGPTFYPRLTPWAAFLRRFAARIVTRGPLFVQSGGCDTVSKPPHSVRHFYAAINRCSSQMLSTKGK